MTNKKDDFHYEDMFTATFTRSDLMKTMTSGINPTAKTFSLRKTISTLTRSNGLHKWKPPPITIHLPQLNSKGQENPHEGEIERLRRMLWSEQVTSLSVTRVYAMTRLLTSKNQAQDLLRYWLSKLAIKDKRFGVDKLWLSMLRDAVTSLE